MPDIPNRYELEASLAQVISKAQMGELKKLMAFLGDPPRLENVPTSFWENGGKALRAAIMPELQKVFTAQAEALVKTLAIGVDWGQVNQSAISWASSYAFDLVKGINETTMRGLQNAIATFYRDGLTLGNLQAMLMGYYGPVRAEMIAVTEVTRASVEGEQAVIQQIERDNASIRMIGFWNTSNDERVCLICKPLNQRKEARRDGHNRPLWKHPNNGLMYGPPPVHPRDRCWANYTMSVLP